MGFDAMETVSEHPDLSQQVLRTDVAGMPLEWIDYRDAVRLYHAEQVAYTCGTSLYRIYGGVCARTGKRSSIEVNSIIATIGRTHGIAELRERYTPPLNNNTELYLSLIKSTPTDPYGPSKQISTKSLFSASS